jgi:hypothetical protein
VPLPAALRDSLQRLQRPPHPLAAQAYQPADRRLWAQPLQRALAGGLGRGPEHPPESVSFRDQMTAFRCLLSSNFAIACGLPSSLYGDCGISSCWSQSGACLLFVGVGLLSSLPISSSLIQDLQCFLTCFLPRLGTACSARYSSPSCGLAEQPSSLSASNLVQRRSTAFVALQGLFLVWPRSCQPWACAAFSSFLILCVYLEKLALGL